MSLALNFREPNFSFDRRYSATRNDYVNLDLAWDEAGETCFIAMNSSCPLSFSPQVLSELLLCAKEMSNDPTLSVRNRVLISSRPGVFSLGGDLAFFRGCIQRGDSGSLKDYALTAVDAIWESITGSGVDDMVSIALVQGEAQGGGFEAALASHVLVAERGTWFGFPEGLFGLFPGMGAKHLLTARASADTACKIIGSARRYSAEELHAEGLIDYLADPGCGRRLLETILKNADRNQLLQLRDRFGDITKEDLVATVLEWTDLAMGLSPKHLRTIDYLIQAQSKARCATPSIRVV